MNKMESILKAIDGAWIANQAAALVKIPSVTMQEAEVCNYFEAQVRDMGLDVDVREVTPGRSNLYARIPGEGKGPALMLNGHLDTIPMGNCVPFRQEGDRIYGRGASDMKGGLAAILGATRALVTAGIRLTGDVWITGVVGHEETEAAKDGPPALISDLKQNRVGGDRILIGEGWDSLWVMSMGSMVFTITLESKQGGKHTTHVPFEENPIRHLGDLIQRITEFQGELNTNTGHPLAGPERIDLGIVQAGDYFNRTPPRSVLTGTRRWCPGQSADAILSGLKNMAAPYAEAGDLALSVEMVHEREPFETPVDDPAVQATAQAHRLVAGNDATVTGKRVVGDANLYVNLGNVPAFYYGPANDTSHSDGEWVSVARVEQAAKVYALTAAFYCGIVD